jgi:hypothetical protein
LWRGTSTGLKFGEGCRGEVSHGLIGGGGQAGEEPDEALRKLLKIIRSYFKR